MSGSNPLSAAPAAPMGSAPGVMNEQPTQQQSGAQMPQINPEDIHQHIEQANYMLPLLGMLAKDPKVTRKDVVKAVSGIMGEGRMTATEAIDLLSKVPSNPDQLRTWLKEKYGHLIAGAVHLNAAAMVHQAMQARNAG